MPNQSGPTSDSGKQISSQNAAKHHMTGRAPFIQGESPQDFEKLLAGWQTDFPTYTTEAAKLVQEAALSEWLLLRVQRQSDPIFNGLFTTGMANWDEAMHKQYQLTQRYLTAAERKLERNRRSILQYRRELRAADRHDRETPSPTSSADTENSTPAEPANAPIKPPTPPAKTDYPRKQSAFVSIEDGVTCTFLSPSNDQIRKTAGLSFDTTILKRTIRFSCDQLPPEYAWCAPRISHLNAPVNLCAVEVVHTMRTFLTSAAIEDAAGGHVQEWYDLPDEDDQLIQQAIDKLCPASE
jgi:hypothetical protein